MNTPGRQHLRQWSRTAMCDDKAHLNIRHAAQQMNDGIDEKIG